MTEGRAITVDTDASPSTVRSVVGRFRDVPSLRAKYADWLADSRAELSDLPILDKQELSVALAEMTEVDPGVRSRAYSFASGGTIAAPQLSLLPDTMFVPDVLAAWQPVDRDDVVVNLYTPGRLWSAHYFYNALALAAGASVIPFGPVQDDEITNWLSFFERQGMTCIAATPTTIGQLLRHCAAHDRDLPGLRKIMWVGERFDEETAALVAERLPRVEMWGNYGSTETWVIGWNAPGCPYDTFHALPYQHVECIDGAVAVTNTHPRCINPLLRYVVGDRGSITTCPCGRTEPALRIEGRGDSYFKFLNQLISPEEVVGLARQMPDVSTAQLVHRRSETTGESLELRIRPSAAVGASVVQRVRAYVLAEHLELGYVVAPEPHRFTVSVVEELTSNGRTAKTPTLIRESTP